jgi:alginate O-acetyltransferase complex protein AlgI
VNAYAPADWHTLIPVAGMCAVLLLLGLIARGGRVRFQCWIAGPVAIAGAHLVLLHEPPGVRMLAFIALLFLWMKAVVTSSRRDTVPVLRWLAWAMLWPGMRFLRGGSALAGASGSCFLGIASILLGVLLIIGAHFSWRYTGSAWIATAPLLLGISLCLHFGLFNVMTGAWRAAGYDAGPLFRAPWASGSLREFWGKRWNIAYTEMMQESVLRPLKQSGTVNPVGPRTATAIIFLFSGLLHEVAISLPVQAGYGLPTAYFALHGAATLVEQRVVSPGTWPARIWTGLLVLLPLPLLFHPWFLRGIVWPLGGIAA